MKLQVGLNCVAPGCRSKIGSCALVHFFKFPEDPERFKLWCGNAKRHDLALLEPEDVMERYQVCSLHFELSMFAAGMTDKLIADAVPTIFNDSDGDGVYPCEHCNLTFTVRQMQKTHERLCRARFKAKPLTDIIETPPIQGSEVQEKVPKTGLEKPMNYRCTVCNYATRNKTTFTRHQQIHAGTKAYKCDFCEYSCIQKSNLQRHVKFHTGVKPFTCQVCGYRCRKNDHMKTHMLIHQGLKPYQCSLCEYKSTVGHNLKRHILTHTGEKKYECDICGYKCREAKALREHVMVHSGVKPHQCGVCGHRCTQASNLKTHMRIHTGFKPYVCTECGFRTNRAGNLKHHMKVHTGERPGLRDYRQEKIDVDVQSLAVVSEEVTGTKLRPTRPQMKNPNTIRCTPRTVRLEKMDVDVESLAVVSKEVTGTKLRPTPPQMKNPNTIRCTPCTVRLEKIDVDVDSLVVVSKEVTGTKLQPTSETSPVQADETVHARQGGYPPKNLNIIRCTPCTVRLEKIDVDVQSLVVVSKEVAGTNLQPTSETSPVQADETVQARQGGYPPKNLIPTTPHTVRLEKIDVDVESLVVVSKEVAGTNLQPTSETSPVQADETVQARQGGYPPKNLIPTTPCTVRPTQQTEPGPSRRDPPPSTSSQPPLEPTVTINGQEAPPDEHAPPPNSGTHPPEWFKKLVFEIRQQEMWKAHQLTKIQNDLSDAENKNRILLEKTIAAVRGRLDKIDGDVESLVVVSKEVAGTNLQPTSETSPVQADETVQAR